MKETIAQSDQWYDVRNVADICSPSLLIYRERLEENIRRMIAIAGDVKRLRPHVKTHKMPEIIKLQMKYGINKFKCATISETEMVAGCGAADILLAMQPVGPNLARFFKIKQVFKNSKISCIADNEEVIIQLSDMSRKTGIETSVWLDINTGMNRTGITPGNQAIRLYNRIIDSPMLIAEGLHVYDGHIHEKDISLRKTKCDDSYASVLTLIEELEGEGISPVKIVAGGTPTFPIHAVRKDVELSPGTLLLWDYGYSSSFADLDFLHAAVLLMRVVSKPAKELLCLDLGHKAVAAEMPHPRVMLLGITNYTVSGQNEEHLVIKTPKADNYKPGDIFYGIPWHICPTVDRHDTVTVVNNNLATEEWKVEARRRKITI